MELKKLGVLEPYRVPDEILREVAPTIGGVPLYDSDYTWYAATMAGFGIIYNKVVLKRLGLPEPKTWEDLARPEVFTWVGSADPRKSGSVHMAYEIILQAYGWERGWQIITALGANVRGFSAGANQTPKDVAVGEVAYGLAIDFYAWAQVREAGEEMIGFVMPADVTVVNGDAIAILKGASNRAIAERFIRFVLSEEGQKLWMLRKGEPDGPQKFDLDRFSLLPGLYPKVKERSSVRLNPFEWKSDFVYDATKGGGRWGIVNDLIGSLVIDPHDRLAITWKGAIKAGNVEADRQRLAAMPVSEEEVQKLVDQGSWQDATFRNRTLNAWASLAREKYLAEDNGASAFRNIPALVAGVLGVVMVVYMRRRSRAS
jgi:ABC-type Fe3+ transport system substrate-binding protein